MPEPPGETFLLSISFFLAANRCSTCTSANHASTVRQGLISAFSDTTNVSQLPNSFWQVPPVLGLNVSGHKSHG